MHLTLFLSLAPLACKPNDHATDNSDSIASYACRGACERFEPFVGKMVHLEIEPTGEMSQVFYNIDPAVLAIAPLILQNVADVNGKATGMDHLLLDEKGKEHDTKAAFADIIAIPSINRISFLSPRAQTIKSRMSSEGFHMNLLKGLSYTLVLNPSGSLEHAPLHVVADISGTNHSYNFSLGNLPKLKGKVIAEDTVLPSTAMSSLIAHVVQGTRLVSSIGKVNDNGEFSIEISDPLFTNTPDQQVTLVIEPGDPSIALPRVKHRIEEPPHKDLDVKDISLGTLKEPIAVTIEVHGSDDSPIANAYLYLNAKVGAGEVTVKKQVNSSGVTNFNELYEGEYDIAVIPPVDSNFAMRVIKAVDFDAKAVQLSIDLQKREAMHTRVYAPNGAPLSGVQLELSRIGEPGNVATEDIYDDNLFKLTAVTDDNGKVCQRKFGLTTSNKDECSSLLLDEGRYLAHIIPPAGSELSHKWLTFDFPDQRNWEITLDHPQILVGKVLRPDKKNPARRAFITIYLAESAMHNQPKVIANAITDEEGYFQAFLSAH